MELYEIRAMIVFPCQNYAYYNILKSWGNNFCRRILFFVNSHMSIEDQNSKKNYNEICVTNMLKSVTF